MLPVPQVEPSVSESNLQVLERFVAENDDLLLLEEKIGRFNIFDALKIERRELQHSNFLAWLLSPNESHGQGDLFLKSILMDVLRKARGQEMTVPVSPVDLDGADLHGVEVRREWRNIDLLISSEHPAFVVAIENKVDSGEHSSQLGRYEATVAASFPGVSCLHVFLTPDGSEASDDDWVNYSYHNLHSVLTRVQRQAGGSLGGDVGVFLAHYLNLVGSKLMNDPDIDDLCQRIYANHSRALELIFERVDVGGTGVVAVISRWLQEQPKMWRVVTTHAKWVKFFPASWIGVLMREDGSPLPTGAEVFWEFDAGHNALKLRCVVGKVDDQDRRKRIIQRLIQNKSEFGFQMKRKEPTEKWTRVYAERSLPLGEDDVPSDDAIIKAISTRLGAFEKLFQPISQAVLGSV
jgi:hypothetical protein